MARWSWAVVFSVPALMAVRPSPPALTSHGYGGSGHDVINGVAVDQSGYIYVAGTTTSFDLPLLNPAQASNSGTELVVSPDEGITWHPLANLPPSSSSLPSSLIVAAAPNDAATFYAGQGAQVFKTIDGGRTFTSANLPVTSPQAYITSLVIDPSTPSTIYASASVGGGVFKTTDGGQSWFNSSSGLPSKGFIDSVVMDPLHPGTLWAWAESGGYVSTDEGASWTQSTLQEPPGTSFGGNGTNFTFDAVTPGVIYGPELLATGSGVGVGVQKTTDGGLTWTHLSTPFNNSYIVADPKRAGYVYSIAYPPVGPPVFYRSTDGGATWQSFPFPGTLSGPLAIDPSDPDIVVAGTFRSTDDGATWTPTTVSRSISAVFAGGGQGVVYASAPITSDIFLGKYQPDGQTLVFATYFGGMGADSAASVKIDSAGNVWVAGTTSSYDLPVTPGALPRNPSATSNVFLAEFSPGGQLLYCTYFGSSGTDEARGLALASDGSVWITGNTNASDFPIAGGGIRSSRSCNCTAPIHPFVSQFQPSATRLLFSTYIGTTIDYAGGIAIDPSGNVVVSGTTYSPDFPVAGGAMSAASPPASNSARVYVVKFDSTGQTLFSTYLGGTTPVTADRISADQTGVAAGVDRSGNLVVAGYTAMSDFPTTAGAYQTTLHGGCAYPAFSIATGFVGVLYQYYYDDAFLIKLSPNGRNLLYSTLLGGACFDRLSDLAVAPDGTAFVAGETDSLDFPQLHPLDTAPAKGGFKSFVSTIDPSGSKLVSSTYLSAGANPVLALGDRGELVVAGAEGPGAQTSSAVGYYPVQTPSTHGYLALISKVSLRGASARFQR